MTRLGVGVDWRFCPDISMWSCNEIDLHSVCFARWYIPCGHLFPFLQVYCSSSRACFLFQKSTYQTYKVCTHMTAFVCLFSKLMEHWNGQFWTFSVCFIFSLILPFIIYANWSQHMLNFILFQSWDNEKGNQGFLLVEQLFLPGSHLVFGQHCSVFFFNKPKFVFCL